jgi:hypothetical protein
MEEVEGRREGKARGSAGGEIEPRVTDSGGARIGHESDRLASLKTFNNGVHSSVLVMVVAAEKTLVVDAETCKEACSDTSVLCSDDIGMP